MYALPSRSVINTSVPSSTPNSNYNIPYANNNNNNNSSSPYINIQQQPLSTNSIPAPASVFIPVYTPVSIPVSIPVSVQRPVSAVPLSVPIPISRLPYKN